MRVIMHQETRSDRPLPDPAPPSPCVTQGQQQTDTYENRRTTFITVAQDAMDRIVALGVRPGLIEPLRREFARMATDNVTEFYEARSGAARTETLRKAIAYVQQTGDEGFYIEMDLRNLSGLNAHLGCTRANVIYKEIAAIVREAFSPCAAAAVFFRHGGDEMSAFLLGTTGEAVRAAMRAVEGRVLRLASSLGLDAIPHPKHPYSMRRRGIGVHFGVCGLSAGHETDPTRVFQEADCRLEEQKTRIPDTWGSRRSDPGRSSTGRGPLPPNVR
jgi:GGDEF domain-containing protein